MQKILDSLKGLGRKQLIALSVAAVILFIAIAVFALPGSTQNMSLLYGDLNLNEAAEMVDDLSKAHIISKTSPDGTRIYVPKAQVASARLLLAKDGLPSGGAVGYELFDKGEALTSTQFEQNINETRAMEGELERSIALLQGVRKVRVHLVLPHRDLFSTQTNPSQASVVLDIGRAGRISADAIQAIQNLVAAAVPGLRPQNISIVDTRGDVLARPGDPDSAAGLASTMDKLQFAEEQRLAQAVEDMLIPTLGSGHVRAKASVVMDTNEVHQTEETYDPNQQVLRSQQTSSEKSVNTESNPNTAVGNNLPNANANQNKTGSSDDRNDETDNYEIGKKVTVTHQTRPRVARISLAVMVDGTVTTDKSGKEIWKPLTDEQIKQITMLAETAIGYDKDRGDKVNVVSMRFRPDDMGRGADQDSLLNRDTLIYIAEWVIPVVLVLSALFIAMWAMRRRGSIEASAEEGDEEAGTGSAGENRSVQGGAQQSGVTGSGDEPVLDADGNIVSSPDNGNRVRVDGVEGDVKENILDDLRHHVENSPGATVSVIRNWLADSEVKKTKG